MSSWLKGLIVVLVGFSAALFCSCRKDCGISFIPETLTDEQFSGAGYAQDFVPHEGELVFNVYGQFTASVNLIVRGRGEAEIQIAVNGRNTTISFDDKDKWQEVAASVQLQKGENLISVRLINAVASPLMVDYIEIQDNR